ncbi:hypothetical protein Patl1_32143 [Pistacia atlantica]|uniref:Uncharacterized protein n=1 Tax=Pistacia atlantica TaxID=434234 RepID=A0ACC1AQU6_9ROSI|nr:hypothetical protein Patl1_32143 [Pistacia atlantica]
MSIQKLLQAFNKTHFTNPTSIAHQAIASNIAKTLIKSGLKPFETTPLLLSNFNSDIANLVLSNSNLPPQSCLRFFKFLRRNPSPVAHKPDLQAHVILICRLYKAQKFAEMKNVLSYIATDVSLRCPVINLVSLIENETAEAKFVEKLCDMLFRVYADNRLFDEAMSVFDYMENSGMKIDERSCMVYLIALKRGDQMNMCFGFFQRMVKANVNITVYTMTIAIDGLCKTGDFKRARDLMDEMIGKGIKANVFTYNTLINGYIKRKDFVGVNEILSLMESDQVAYNAATYTLVIEWYGTFRQDW